MSSEMCIRDSPHTVQLRAIRAAEIAQGPAVGSAAQLCMFAADVGITHGDGATAVTTDGHPLGVEHMAAAVIKHQRCRDRTVNRCGHRGGKRLHDHGVDRRGSAAGFGRCRQ